MKKKRYLKNINSPFLIFSLSIQFAFNFGLGGGDYGCSPIEQGISSGYLDLYGEWLDDDLYEVLDLE